MDPTTALVVAAIVAVLVVVAGIEMALTRRPKRRTPRTGLGIQATIRPAYQDVLVRLGGYLSIVKAEDFYIGELPDGYLLLYSSKGSQAVETMTFAQIAELGKLSTARGFTTVQRHLESIGRYLDNSAGVSVVVFPQSRGYAIEYAVFAQGQHMAAEIARVNRYMDNEALERLGSR